jgi:hypothetical protein
VLLQVIAIFTAVGFFLHRWFSERGKANEQTNQTQHPASNMIANPTCPWVVSAIPEAKAIWVSPQHEEVQQKAIGSTMHHFQPYFEVLFLKHYGFYSFSNIFSDQGDQN